jgi:iron complex transport system ATP-binding protein
MEAKPVASLPSVIEMQDTGVYRSGRWILRHVDWSVPTGSCAAVLGPNGSGKSTAARIIAGHLYPSAGECSILGQAFGQTDLGALRKRIRLLQPAGPYDVDADLTALEVVLTGWFGTIGLYDEVSRFQRTEARRWLARLGLGTVKEHPYGTLSSGEKVRALIARALVAGPEILLLDEPTAGLDLLAREQILATVQSLFDDGAWRPTVVLITHHVEELPPATSHVLLLSEGRVAASGTPLEVLTEPNLSRVYGCPVQVSTLGGRWYVQVHPEAWRRI